MNFKLTKGNVFDNGVMEDLIKYKIIIIINNKQQHNNK